MDEEWLLENFFTDDGFIRDFAHDVLLVRGSLARNAYRSRTIAKEMVAMPIPQGSVEELMRMLFKGEEGHWFYAGWIDQAVLHIGKIRSGDIEDFGIMITQMDLDQVDQSGDMVVAFIAEDGESIATIEVCPDDSTFEVHLRTDQQKKAREASRLRS
jgi:hypothetical protein